MVYRGYEIKRILYQGVVCYRTPGIPGNDIAVRIEAAKRWIDSWILENRATNKKYFCK